MHNTSYHKEFLFRRASPPGSRYNPFEAHNTLSVPQCKSLVGGVRGSAYSTIIYPNGEFGVGYKGREKKSSEEKNFDIGIVNGVKTEWVPREHELEDGSKYYDSGDMVPNSFILDSPDELSQTKRYGLHGITPLGKKMVRNGTFLLEGRLRRPGDYTQFSTVTLPRLGEVYERYICSHWAEVVKKFFQECKRQYARYARTFHYCSCTEIQPKRWKAHKFVGLHLHFVYNAAKYDQGKKWVITDTWMMETWVRILNNTLHTASTELGEPPLTLHWVSYKRVPVEKSAQNYIGKYLSKGGAIIDEVRSEKGEEYLPKQWWSMSAFLRATIKRKTIRTTVELVCEHIISAIERGDKEIVYWYPSIQWVEHDDGYGNRSSDIFLFGYGGKMSPRLLRECKFLCRKRGQGLTRDCVASYDMQDF